MVDANIAHGVLEDRSGLLKGERAFVEKSFDQGGGDGAASNSRTKGKLVACAAVVASAWRPRVAAVHDGARGHIQQAQPRIVMIDAPRRRADAVQQPGGRGSDAAKADDSAEPAREHAV